MWISSEFRVRHLLKKNPKNINMGRVVSCDIN